MLEFRTAAAANNLLDLERLSDEMGANFNINEPGPKSGKTAAHVASERAHFKAIYWLCEKGANFYSKDNAGKTALDYLQKKEFTFAGSNPMAIGDRKYHLCNAHYKIWLAHQPENFMPYLYQNDFRQYREKNPAGYISLVYSTILLSNKALKDLAEFADKYQIDLISFEEDLAKLTDHFGTEEDKECYRLALYELNKYPDQGGGNLAVVADLIRWSSVLLRKGNYADTDVEIGQHSWTNSITMEKSCALNLGSLVHPNGIEPWLNGDIIAVSSLFSHPHEGDFRVTLSKAACFMIEKVQSSLILSCQKKMEKRIVGQQFIAKTLSNVSSYMQDFFHSCHSTRSVTDNFSSEEINRLQANGLELFSQEEKASILERMANLMRKRVEEEFGSPERAQKYSRVLQGVKNDEHEKFLINYMQAIQMTNTKESLKAVTGSYVFSGPIWQCIGSDDWEKYSIYSSDEVQSAFRSANTVKFNTDVKENQRVTQTKKCADLSFTPFGMKGVLERSEKLRAEHHKS